MVGEGAGVLCLHQLIPRFSFKLLPHGLGLVSQISMRKICQSTSANKAALLTHFTLSSYRLDSPEKGFIPCTIDCPRKAFCPLSHRIDKYICHISENDTCLFIVCFFLLLLGGVQKWWLRFSSYMRLSGKDLSLFPLPDTWLSIKGFIALSEFWLIVEWPKCWLCELIKSSQLGQQYQANYTFRVFCSTKHWFR